MEDHRTLSTNKLANEEGSWIIGILHLRGRSGDQVIFIVTQSHSNFVYVQRDQNFFKEKRRLSSFIISKTLDWGANENTEKLPITRLTCHALIYGARSVLKTKITLALMTRCQKYRGQFYDKTNESDNKSINTETRQEVDRENPSIQRNTQVLCSCILDHLPL